MKILTFLYWCMAVVIILLVAVPINHTWPSDDVNESCETVNGIKMCVEDQQ